VETIPSAYYFGKFTLDVGKGCVLKGQEEIKLRPKVFEALQYFVQNSGRLIGKQELIQAIWPDSFVTDDSLVQCTVELRRALDDREQQLLKTVPRRGYLFTADVTQSKAKATAPSETELLDAKRERESAVGKPNRRLIDIPTPRTSLIGREQEVRKAAEFLLDPHIRLVTLTGPGGAGKTRLAIAAAASVASEFPGGVRFVGLASVTQSDLVATALTKSLDLQQVANRTLPQLIADYLQESGPFLFVLDNFEQVLPAGRVVAEILASCPALKVLVTSRECLRIYGEQEFPVAPLEEDSAIQLFVQRAAAVRPTFALNPENSDAIREICRRLEPSYCRPAPSWNGCKAACSC
jgi:DNA-binding winged helix-turn-helix (wHTH) protein